MGSEEKKKNLKRPGEAMENQLKKISTGEFNNSKPGTFAASTNGPIKYHKTKHVAASSTSLENQPARTAAAEGRRNGPLQWHTAVNQGYNCPSKLPTVGSTARRNVGEQLGKQEIAIASFLRQSRQTRSGVSSLPSFAPPAFKR